MADNLSVYISGNEVDGYTIMLQDNRRALWSRQKNAGRTVRLEMLVVWPF